VAAVLEVLLVLLDRQTVQQILVAAVAVAVQGLLALTAQTAVQELLL
jgi:hypothetical protein